MSSRTTEQWLAEGVCPRGHSLFGPAELYRHGSGKVECAACRRDMLAERVALAEAARLRVAQGRGH